MFMILRNAIFTTAQQEIENAKKKGEFRNQFLNCRYQLTRVINTIYLNENVN